MRKVLKKDWDYILNLRNNEEYRNFFYSSETISKQDHYNYLENQKSNPNFVNWIICYNDDDVGYVRILDNDVSIMLDTKYQNKGIGSSALKMLEIEAKKLGITKLIGRVMVSNNSSKKIFEKNNYDLEMYWLEKKL